MKEGSDALAEPSLTLIVMPANVPAAVGVPVRRPVVVLNEAHAGRFAMLNVSVLPSGSLAVGVNEYAVPAVTVVARVPEIVGGWFAWPWTVSVNAGSEALADPSLPAKGPGRAYYEGPKGDFLLSEFRFAADGKPVKFAAASESYAKLGLINGPSSAQLALDGMAHTGWATAGREGKPSNAVFALGEPLTAQAATCYEGITKRVHRNQKLSLKFKTKVVNGVVTVHDVTIKENTLDNSALESCFIQQVQRTTWTDASLPDYEAEDELVLRPERGMKKFMRDNVEYQGTEAPRD